MLEERHRRAKGNSISYSPIRAPPLNITGNSYDSEIDKERERITMHVDHDSILEQQAEDLSLKQHDKLESRIRLLIFSSVLIVLGVLSIVFKSSIYRILQIPETIFDFLLTWTQIQTFANYQPDFVSTILTMIRRKENITFLFQEIITAVFLFWFGRNLTLILFCRRVRPWNQHSPRSSSSAESAQFSRSFETFWQRFMQKNYSVLKSLYFPVMLIMLVSLVSFIDNFFENESTSIDLLHSDRIFQAVFPLFKLILRNIWQNCISSIQSDFLLGQISASGVLFLFWLGIRVWKNFEISSIE